MHFVAHRKRSPFRDVIILGSGIMDETSPEGTVLCCVCARVEIGFPSANNNVTPMGFESRGTLLTRISTSMTGLFVFGVNAELHFVTHYNPKV